MSIGGGLAEPLDLVRCTVLGSTRLWLATNPEGSGHRCNMVTTLDLFHSSRQELCPKTALRLMVALVSTVETDSSLDPAEALI